MGHDLKGLLGVFAPRPNSGAARGREVPRAIKTEARRRAEQIFDQLTEVMEREMRGVAIVAGREMCRLVLRELEELEREMPAAALGIADPS